MRLPLYQIDAFAETPFTGNPAAVCPLEYWISDALMQSIALENNLSETAFLCRQEVSEEGDGRARYHLRWFTPTVEVDLCGHATLASAFLVFDQLDPEATEVLFETRSGVLTVSRSADRGLTMDFPALPPGGSISPAEQIQALGATPESCYSIREVHGAAYQLWVFQTAREVADLDPEFASLTSNIIATAPADPEAGLDFVSRFFGPLSGVDEDPVTGSAHCTLTPYWAARLGKNRLEARQISARGGRVSCQLDGDRVHLAGSSVLYLKGEITVPG